jgi:UDP-N-acetylmuramate dehydrogenase
VRLCCSKGLCGLESLVGIPGTVGGAIFMNAGGWHSPLYRNISDYVVSLKVMDYNGNLIRLKKEKLEFGYRSSNLSKYIIIEAWLGLGKENASILTSRCYKFLKMKRDKQVLNIPSAGCVFKNPADFQFTTGQMIDMLGLKGTMMGGAQISERHANFIINKNSATASDVLRLIDLMKNKVMENYHIPLELEIKVIPPPKTAALRPRCTHAGCSKDRKDPGALARAGSI